MQRYKTIKSHLKQDNAFNSTYLQKNASLEQSSSTNRQKFYGSTGQYCEIFGKFYERDINRIFSNSGFMISQPVGGGSSGLNRIRGTRERFNVNLVEAI